MHNGYHRISGEGFHSSEPLDTNPSVEYNNRRYNVQKESELYDDDDDSNQEKEINSNTFDNHNREENLSEDGRTKQLYADALVENYLNQMLTSQEFKETFNKSPSQISLDYQDLSSTVSPTSNAGPNVYLDKILENDVLQYGKPASPTTVETLQALPGNTFVTNLDNVYRNLDNRPAEETGTKPLILQQSQKNDNTELMVSGIHYNQPFVDQNGLHMNYDNAIEEYELKNLLGSKKTAQKLYEKVELMDNKLEDYLNKKGESLTNYLKNKEVRSNQKAEDSTDNNNAAEENNHRLQIRRKKLIKFLFLRLKKLKELERLRSFEKLLLKKKYKKAHRNSAKRKSKSARKLDLAKIFNTITPAKDIDESISPLETEIGNLNSSQIEDTSFEDPLLEIKNGSSSSTKSYNESQKYSPLDENTIDKLLDMLLEIRNSFNLNESVVSVQNNQTENKLKYLDGKTFSIKILENKSSSEIPSENNLNISTYTGANKCKNTLKTFRVHGGKLPATESANNSFILPFQNVANDTSNNNQESINDSDEVRTSKERLDSSEYRSNTTKLIPLLHYKSNNIVEQRFIKMASPTLRSNINNNNINNKHKSEQNNSSKPRTNKSYKNIFPNKYFVNHSAQRVSRNKTITKFDLRNSNNTKFRLHFPMVFNNSKAPAILSSNNRSSTRSPLAKGFFHCGTKTHVNHSVRASKPFSDIYKSFAKKTGNFSTANNQSAKIEKPNIKMRSTGSSMMPVNTFIEKNFDSLIAEKPLFPKLNRTLINSVNKTSVLKHMIAEKLTQFFLNFLRFDKRQFSNPKQSQYQVLPWIRKNQTFFNNKHDIVNKSSNTNVSVQSLFPRNSSALNRTTVTKAIHVRHILGNFTKTYSKSKKFL